MGEMVRYIFMIFFFIKDTTAYKIELLIALLFDCVYIYYFFFILT